MADVDVTSKTTMDASILDTLTNSQLAVLSGLNASGQYCLIQSWMNSPYSGQFCYIPLLFAYKRVCLSHGRCKSLVAFLSCSCIVISVILSVCYELKNDCFVGYIMVYRVVYTIDVTSQYI